MAYGVLGPSLLWVTTCCCSDGCCGEVLSSLGMVAFVCGVSFLSARTPGHSCAVSYGPVTAPSRTFEQLQWEGNQAALTALRLVSLLGWGILDWMRLRPLIFESLGRKSRLSRLSRLLGLLEEKTFLDPASQWPTFQSCPSPCPLVGNRPVTAAPPLTERREDLRGGFMLCFLDDGAGMDPSKWWADCFFRGGCN